MDNISLLFDFTHKKNTFVLLLGTPRKKFTVLSLSREEERGHAFVVSMAHRVPARANPAVESCFEIFSVSTISLYMVGVILILYSYAIPRHKIPGGNVDHKLRS